MFMKDIIALCVWCQSYVMPFFSCLVKKNSQGRKIFIYIVTLFFHFSTVDISKAIFAAVN